MTPPPRGPRLRGAITARGWAWLVLLAACTPTGGELVSPEGAHRVVGVDPDHKVSVVLTTEAWEGSPPDLDREVTVVHALVSNQGPHRVRLYPADLELRDQRGFRFRLLDAGGRVTTVGGPPAYPYPIQASKVGVIESTGPDLAAMALPFGVLEPGTQLRGYLYFEPVEYTANDAVLTWSLRDDRGAALATLRFDFRVASRTSGTSVGP